MSNWEPVYEILYLTHGDFIYSKTAPFTLPPGTTAEIVWKLDTPVTWDASVDDSTITWRIESEDCDAATIPQRTRFEMWLHYPNEETETADDIVWKLGHAQRTPIDEE